MNLYDELNLQPGASDAEIKAAHRRLVKECHPDKAGGDTAKFQRVQLAFDTLKDKDKRKRYDETGQTAGATAPDETLEALAVIFEGMVSEMLQEGVSIETQDMRALLISKIEGRIKDTSQERDKLERQAKKARNLLKRWKRKRRAKGPDIMADTLRRRERDIQDQVAKTKDAVRIWGRAKALLTSYEYEVDLGPDPATTTSWGVFRFDLGKI